MCKFQERKKALNTQESFLVHAPAGSGKTTLLLERYIKLLATGVDAKDVIILTFSHKSCLDIKYKAKKMIDSEITSLELGINLSNISIDKIRAYTIDAFAYHLVSKEFTYSICPDSTALYNLAVDKLFSLISPSEETQKQCISVAKEYNFDLFLIKKALVRWLSKRNIVINNTKADKFTKQFCLNFLSTLKEEFGINDNKEKITSTLNTNLAFDCIEDFFIFIPWITQKYTIKIRCPVFIFLNRVSQKTMMILTALFNYKTGGYTTSKICFFELLVQNLHSVFANEKKIDFIHLIELAIPYIKNTSFKHILVDECQDLSESHYTFIERIAKEIQKNKGTIFCVGDPMQSIYRFRGAYGKIFSLKHSKKIANITMLPVNLSQNFRSDKILVNFCNRFFSILSDTRQQQFKIKLPFVESYASQDANKAALIPWQFNLFSTSQDQYSFIKKQLDEFSLYKNKTVAILFYSRNQAREFINYLDSMQLHYVNGFHSLYNVVEGKILALMLRLIKNPHSFIGWCQCIYLINQKISCAATTLQQIYTSKIDQFLKDNYFELYSMYLNIVYINNYFFSDKKQLYKEFILAYSNMFSHNVSILTHILDQCFCWDIDKFTIEEIILYLKNTMLHSEVSDFLPIVTTIHQTKGLEFDFVVIPDIHKKIKSYREEIVIYDDNGKIHAKGEKGWYILNALEKIEHIIETDKLLYVAITRAKEKLLITGININLSNNTMNILKKI